MRHVKTSDALEYFEDRLKYWEYYLKLCEEDLQAEKNAYESTLWSRLFNTSFEKSWSYSSLKVRIIQADIKHSRQQLDKIKSLINACRYNLSMNYTLFEWDDEMAGIYKFYDYIAQR